MNPKPVSPHLSLVPQVLSQRCEVTNTGNRDWRVQPLLWLLGDGVPKSGCITYTLWHFQKQIFKKLKDLCYSTKPAPVALFFTSFGEYKHTLSGAVLAPVLIQVCPDINNSILPFKKKIKEVFDTDLWRGFWNVWRSGQGKPRILSIERGVIPVRAGRPGMSTESWGFGWGTWWGAAGVTFWQITSLQFDHLWNFEF